MPLQGRRLRPFSFVILLLAGAGLAAALLPLLGLVLHRSGRSASVSEDDSESVPQELADLREARIRSALARLFHAAAPPEQAPAEGAPAEATAASGAPARSRGQEPFRHPQPVIPGLTPEAKLLWDDPSSTTRDIDRAYALDVCTCSSLDCISALQAPFYARRGRAQPVAPSPVEEAAIRTLRNDCHLRLSRLKMAKMSGEDHSR